MVKRESRNGGSWAWAMAVTAALLLGACESADKVPAQTAIKAAEDALAGAKAEAAKYVPDLVQSAENTLQTAKVNFEKKDYKAALTGAQEAATKAKDMIAAAATKKAELTQAWGTASAGVPQMAEAIKGRLDILSQSKKLPAGLDAGKLDAAKPGLADLDQLWTQASDAFKAGNLSDAASKASAAKTKAAEIMTALNMQVPAEGK